MNFKLTENVLNSLLEDDQAAWLHREELQRDSRALCDLENKWEEF